MDAKPSETRDLVATARERVRIGAAPDWIVPCLYDADFKEKVRGPVTHLLIEQQVHAELHQTFVRVATRLETLQAVQSQSQWRLEFEPQTQSIILHSIKVRRGLLGDRARVAGPNSVSATGIRVGGVHHPWMGYPVVAFG